MQKRCEERNFFIFKAFYPHDFLFTKMQKKITDKDSQMFA